MRNHLLAVASGPVGVANAQNNAATVSQTLPAVGMNNIVLQQLSDGNTATLTQMGVGNGAAVTQQ